MRQRMESVQEALLEMREHMHRLGETPDSSCGNKTVDFTFDTLLASHLGRYRVAGQTATHLGVVGGGKEIELEQPAIELF